MLGANVSESSRAGNKRHLSYNRKWAANNKDKINARRRERYAEKKVADPAGLRDNKRAEKLKVRYGITPEQHNALFASQGNACAICCTEEPGSRVGWHTDHNHETGAVRGILCHHCNLLLGKAKDNPATLARAIEYLKCEQRI
jgi:hypothetical protein